MPWKPHMETHLPTPTSMIQLQSTSTPQCLCPHLLSPSSTLPLPISLVTYPPIFSTFSLSISFFFSQQPSRGEEDLMGFNDYVNFAYQVFDVLIWEGTLDRLQTGQASRVRSFPHVDGNYALHVYIPGNSNSLFTSTRYFLGNDIYIFTFLPVSLLFGKWNLLFGLLLMQTEKWTTLVHIDR